jgi:hypothetical protein
MLISPETIEDVEAATCVPIRTPRPDPANPLARSPLVITADDVLVGWRGAPRLFCGHSPDGQRWVVARIDAGVATSRWLCAPASELATRCLLLGRTTARNLFRHSSTGMVDDVVLMPDGRFYDSLRLCADLDGELSDLVAHERCA